MADSKKKISATVELKTDKKSFDNAKKQIESLKGNFSSLKDSLVSTTTAIISTIATLTKMTDYTDKLVTSQRLLATSFGESASKVQQYADKLVYIAGLSKSEVYNELALFGQTATSLGMANETAEKFSENISTLSAKMAALYNTDFEKMSDSLRAVAKGATKQFTSLTGIVLKEQQLQDTLTSLGINRTVSSLNSAEKAMVQYIAIARQMNNVDNQMADATASVAYQKQMLKNQVKEVATAFGSILYPILQKVLPVLNAILIVIKNIIGVLGKIAGVGKKTAETANNISGGMEGIGASAGSAAKAVNKSLRSFDKLNNIQTPDAGSSGGGGAGIGAIDDSILSSFDSLQQKLDNIKNKAQEIADSIMKWLGFTKDANGEWHLTEVTLGNVLVLAGLLYGAFKLISAFSLEKLFVSLGKLASNGGIIGAFAKIGEGISLWLGGAATFSEVLTAYILPALGTIATIVGSILAIAYGILEIFVGIKELKMGDYFNGILDIIIGISAIVAGIALLFGGWIVAAVAAVVAIVALIVKHWDKISAFMKKIGKWVNDNVIQPILDFIRPVTTWLYDNVILPVIEFFKPIVDAIVNIFKTIWDNLTSIVTGIYNAVASVVTKLWEIYKKIVEIFVTLAKAFYTYVIEPIWTKYIKPAFDTIYKSIIKPIINLFADVGSWVYNHIIKPVWDKIVWLKDKAVGIFKTIGTTVVNFVGGSIKSVINGILSNIEGTVNFFIKAINKAINVINKIPGVSITKIQELSIPRLANGGFVDEGQLFIANEAGPELVGKMNNHTAVANNDQITKGIEEASFQGMMKALMATGGNKTKVEITAQGDTSGLLDFITFKQKQADRRNGL